MTLKGVKIQEYPKKKNTCDIYSWQKIMYPKYIKISYAIIRWQTTKF